MDIELEDNKRCISNTPPSKRAMMALKRSPELRLAMEVMASVELEMPIKGFSCFSSGGHFVQWSKTIL